MKIIFCFFFFKFFQGHNHFHELFATFKGNVKFLKAQLRIFLRLTFCFNGMDIIDIIRNYSQMGFFVLSQKEKKVRRCMALV